MCKLVLNALKLGKLNLPFLPLHKPNQKERDGTRQMITITTFTVDVLKNIKSINLNVSVNLLSGYVLKNSILFFPPLNVSLEIKLV